MAAISRLLFQPGGFWVSVYLAGRFVFRLPAEIVVNQKLAIGQSLSASQVEKLTRLAHFSAFYQKSLTFLSRRLYSEKEIRQKLHQFAFRRQILSSLGKEITQEVIDKLKEKKLLDDDHFAVLHLRQRLLLKPRSKRLLTKELRQKGLKNEVIAKLLVGIDELQLATSLYDKKKPLFCRLEGQAKKDKIIRYFSQQGFPWSVIESLLKKE